MVPRGAAHRLVLKSRQGLVRPFSPLSPGGKPVPPFFRLTAVTCAFLFASRGATERIFPTSSGSVSFSFLVQRRSTLPFLFLLATASWCSFSWPFPRASPSIEEGRSVSFSHRNESAVIAFSLPRTPASSSKAGSLFLSLGRPLLSRSTDQVFSPPL